MTEPTPYWDMRPGPARIAAKQAFENVVNSHAAQFTELEQHSNGVTHLVSVSGRHFYRSQTGVMHSFDSRHAGWSRLALMAAVADIRPFNPKNIGVTVLPDGTIQLRKKSSAVTIIKGNRQIDLLNAIRRFRRPQPKPLDPPISGDKDTE